MERKQNKIFYAIHLTVVSTDIMHIKHSHILLMLNVRHKRDSYYDKYDEKKMIEI